MDYRHKPPHRGVNFGRRSGVNIQRRLTPRRLVVAAAAEGHHRVKDTADESGRPGGCRPSSGTLIIEP